MRTYLVAASVLAVSSLIACAAPGDEGSETSEANATTEARVLGTVKGRELARCWFDRAGDNQQLSCTSTARGQDPLDLDVRASVAGSNGIFAKLDVERGRTSVVGSIPADSFPRDVEITANFDPDDRYMLGVDARDWSASLKNVDPTTLTKDKPLVLSEPFDFWEIGTVYAVTKGGGYTFATLPYKLGSMTFEADIATTAPKTKFIVAPKDGPLPVIWKHEGKKIETTITGPGYYALADDGIRPATPAEVAAKYATHSSSPSSSSSSSGSTVDAGPPPSTDPDPSCGGANQSACNGKSCDSGTRYDFGTCVACGAAGQTYCYVDVNGRDPSAGKKCNKGTRYDFGSCVACGGENQTYCYADPNGVDPSSDKTCKSGLHYAFGSCVK